MELKQIDKLVQDLLDYGLDEMRITRTNLGVYKVVPNILRMEQIAGNLKATPTHFYVGNNWRDGVNVFFEYKEDS